MKTLLSKTSTFVIGIFIGIVSVTLITTLLNESERPQQAINAVSLADEIMEQCKDDEHRPACYDRELPKLMDDGYSMEEVFMVTREVQHRDDSYQYCHVLGHFLSQKETAKDPSLWKDVFARAPRGICSNGAIHGAFQERFNAEALPDATTEELRAELLGICEARKNWSPTGLERGSCLHALGHLTMYVTDGDINRSLELCDELIPAQGDYRGDTQLCYDGAFMQIFQPLEPEDEALVAKYGIDNLQKSKELCSKYTAEQFGSCTSESWAMAHEAIKDPKQILSICDPLNEVGGYQLQRCTNNVFYIAAAQLNLNVSDIEAFCSAVPDPYHHVCFRNSTSRLIEVDWDNIHKSIALCEAAEASGAFDSCFDELVTMSDFTFDKNSEHFTLLCDSMPEPYQSRCFSKL